MRQPPAFVLTTIRTIDEVSRWFGIAATWLVLFCALLSALNAILRYSSGGFLWLQSTTGIGAFGAFYDWYSGSANGFSDAIWYMFAATVMLAGAWTLKVNAHVRVDLVYGSVGGKTRTWIDLLGGLFFLLPLCVLLIDVTWGWAWTSLVTGEASANTGGLPAWPAKMLLPVGFALVALQGLAEITKCILALTTSFVREFAYEKPVQ